MTDSAEIKAALGFLDTIDQQDYQSAWKDSSVIVQSAVTADDFVKSIRAARSPLGAVTSRTMGTIESPYTPVGAPDGNYMKILYKSVFEKKSSAQETLTLFEESDGIWRVAGYFIK